MRTKHTTMAQVLLAVLPALLLAFVLQPAVSLADDVTHTVTYLVGDAHIDPMSIDHSSDLVRDGHNISLDATIPHAYENDSNYWFDCWTADKDVELLNVAGVFPAGTPLSRNQADLIIVTQDIKLTAHSIALYDDSTMLEKYATITYTTDGHGVFRGDLDAMSERVSIFSGPASIPTPEPNDNYEFAYWTADVPIFNYWSEAVKNNWDSGDFILAGTHLKTNWLSLVKVRENTTFTAHFRATKATVTYKADPAAAGSVDPTTEAVDLVSTEALVGLDGVDSFGSIKGSTPTLADPTKYEFTYWTADKDLYEDTSDGYKVITAGTQLSTERITSGNIFVTQDTVFTANFKEIGSDPEPDTPDDSDDSGKIQPADGSGSKVLPKTGDTLPGGGVAVALSAGVAVVAATALLRERCR